jgi:hypothetical protein
MALTPPDFGRVDAGDGVGTPTQDGARTPDPDPTPRASMGKKA